MPARPSGERRVSRIASIDSFAYYYTVLHLSAICTPGAADRSKVNLPQSLSESCASLRRYGYGYGYRVYVWLREINLAHACADVTVHFVIMQRRCSAAWYAADRSKIAIAFPCMR